MTLTFSCFRPLLIKAEKTINETFHKTFLEYVNQMVFDYDCLVFQIVLLSLCGIMVVLGKRVVHQVSWKVFQCLVLLNCHEDNNSGRYFTYGDNH